MASNEGFQSQTGGFGDSGAALNSKYPPPPGFEHPAVNLDFP